MAIIRPPVSGDSPQDSWANQVTEAINKGLLAPSINAATPPVNVSLNGISAATIYLYTRTTTATAPTAVDVDITYDYKNISFSPSAPFGTSNWETSPPSTIYGDYLWLTVVNISANIEKELIPASSWSTPTIFTVNGNSSFVCEAFIRSATTPGQPSGGSYNFSTRVLTPPIGSPASEVWSNSITAGDDPVYICTAIAVITGSTGTDSNLTWSQPVKMVENGAAGPTGATGATGLAGDDIETGLVYYTTPQASSPGTPSATDYNFSTGVFSNLTTGWQTQPVVVNITTTTALYWSSRYRVTKAPTDSTATISFNSPIASVNFGTNIQSDNYVEGSSGWQIQRSSGDAEFNNVNIRGGLISPSIVSAAITANSITADQIDVDTLVIGSKNILTLDGSAIATRTHRTTIDDYTDGLNNVIVGTGSANGSIVTSGSATQDLRYRFTVQVDIASSASTNNLRTRRFYYPIFTANTGYSIEGGNIAVFLVDDITSAQTTGFYVGVNSVDFYSSGGNNNSRQVILGIGTNMYLNQSEVLRPIDPAVEFANADAGQLFEVKFTADGTNVPSFTAFSLTAYAVNIEEFFQQSSPGTYSYTNTFEAVTNVQLTGTTSTTPYAASVNTSSITTSGSGTIYGIVRGY